MANGRFLLWLKNVLKVNTIPGYMADFDKTRGDSVFIDNSNRVMEINNLQEGLTPTIYNGLKASVLDGSSQYWQLALPAEQITNSTFETNVLNWTATGTLTQDAELGKQGNYCAKWVYATNQTLTPTLTIAPTVGQKYKVKLYYKSTTDISFQSGTTTVKTLSATSEWNYVSFIFTAVSTSVRLLGTAVGTGFFDNVSMVLDQGLDANEDKERILHSKNAEFERTLGAELSSGTVTIGKKYIVTAGVVEGNVLGTEFLAVTTATTLDASNKVKEIPNLVTNGTLVDGTGWTAGTGCTFTGGVAQINNVAVASGFSFCTQNLGGSVITKRLRLTFEIKNYSSGSLRINGGGNTQVVPNTNSNGVKTFDYSQSSNSTGFFGFYLSSGETFVGDIDNIHIYEIPEWTASGNHTGDVSIIDKSGTGATNTQSLKVTASGAGDSGSNHIKLPSANLESCVAGKKYTIQGEARLDPASLSYGANLLSGDGTSGWNVGNGTGGVVSDEYVLASTGTGFIYRSLNSPNNIIKVTFKAKADTYTGLMNVYQQSAVGSSLAITANLTSTYRTFTVYLVAKATQQTFYIQLVTSHTGNIYFDDITIQEATPVTITQQIGTKSVNSGALSIVQGSFTKFVMNFEATASEVNADWKAYLSGIGAVFVDSLSLTQSFDLWVTQRVKHTLGAYVGYSLSMYTTGKGGLQIAKASDNKLYTYIYDNSNSVVNSTGETLDANYNNISVLSTNSEHKIYLNGVLKDADSTLALGKKTNGGLRLGWALDGGGTRMNGLVATTQIIRFDNISKTNFNPNTYQPGDAITDNGGGVPEVVLWQDWSNIVGAIAIDKYRPETTRRNDLTAYGSPLASTNIVTVKDFSPQTKKLRQGSVSLQPTFNSVSGFVFNGTNNILIASQNFGDVKTIILKIKVDTLESEQDLLQLNDSTVITLNTDGSITATGFFEETIKIQTTLLADALITTDQEYLVCVKSGGGISTDSFKLGGSSTYLKGNIKKVTLFSTELDDATIQKIFKSIRSI